MTTGSQTVLCTGWSTQVGLRQYDLICDVKCDA